LISESLTEKKRREEKEINKEKKKEKKKRLDRGEIEAGPRIMHGLDYSLASRVGNTP